MLLSMFNEYSRPFYQSSEIMELEKIIDKILTQNFAANPSMVQFADR